LLAFAFSRAFHYRRAAWCGRRMRYGMHGGWGSMAIGGSCGRVRHRERPVAEPKVEPVVELTPAQKRERAVVDLRRRYVADEITVEEYEAGLDRILKTEY